jgi:hypothetical protein
MKKVCIKIYSKARTNNPHYTLQNYIDYTYEKALLNEYSHFHIQGCVTYVFESVFKFKKNKKKSLLKVLMLARTSTSLTMKVLRPFKSQVTHYPVGRRHIPEERRAQLTFLKGLIDCCFIRLVTSYVETAF